MINWSETKVCYRPWNKCHEVKQLMVKNSNILAVELNIDHYEQLNRNRDSSPTRHFPKFPDTFEDSSPTLLFKVKWPVTDNDNFITSNYGFIDVFEDSSPTDVFTLHLYTWCKSIKNTCESMRISEKFIISAPECILVVRKCFLMFINCIVLSRWWYIIIIMYWSRYISSSKYLGVTINDHLTWNDRIQNTVTSASKNPRFHQKKHPHQRPAHQRGSI